MVYKNVGFRLIDHMAVVMSTGILLTITIINGYLLVFPDSGTYIHSGINTFLSGWPDVSWSRPIFYSLFTFPLHGMYSLWPIGVAQSLLAAYTIYILLRVLEIKHLPLISIIIVSILAGLTSLPWFVGFLTPDIFTSLLVIALFIVAFKLQNLRPYEKFFLLILITASISFHFSHVPLAIGLLICFFLIKMFAGNTISYKSLAYILTTIIIALSSLSLSNMASRGSGNISTHGTLFMLARGIEDGIVQQYLRKSCAENNKYKLCAYTDKLEMNVPEFLWNQESSPLYAIGVNEVNLESSEIIINTIKSYPLQYISISIKNLVKQWIHFSTGTWLKPYDTFGDSIMKNYFPSESASFYLSRQYTSTLGIETVSRIHNTIIYLSFCASILALILSIKMNKPMLVWLFLTIFLALLGNAFVCGALSIPTDRYQSRLIWLVPFYSIASLSLLWQSRNRSPAVEEMIQPIENQS